jgi:nitrous oxidase accessory protein
MKISYSIIILFWAFGTLFGNQTTVCPTCSQKSISKAILLSEQGDTILIKKGLYKENKIIIDKPLSIIGEEGTIIDSEGEEAITVISDNVLLQGLQIQNVGTSYTEDQAGIRIRKSKNFTILNNKLINTFFGIYIEHSDDGVIENNLLEGEAIEEMSSGNAIHLWYCKNISIKNNTVRKHRDGIYLEFVDNSVVEGNISTNNLRYGLHFMFSNHDDYFRNEFSENGAGVAVMFSKYINMWENNFYHNWGKASYGLLLKEIYDTEIRNNNFQENTMKTILFKMAGL